jgi:hypothetical protein
MIAASQAAVEARPVGKRFKSHLPTFIHCGIAASAAAAARPCQTKKTVRIRDKSVERDELISMGSAVKRPLSALLAARSNQLRCVGCANAALQWRMTLENRLCDNAVCCSE